MAEVGSAQLEAQFFSTLNAVVEPLIRAGFAFPTPFTPGPIVVETIGRASGQRRNVPLMAVLLGDVAVAGTYRGRRSQWPRNLAAQPEVRYWLAGQPCQATAFVFFPGAPPPTLESLPAALRPLAPTLAPLSTQSGFIIAALALRRPET